MVTEFDGSISLQDIVEKPVTDPVVQYYDNTQSSPLEAYQDRVYYAPPTQDNSFPSNAYQIVHNQPKNVHQSLNDPYMWQELPLITNDFYSTRANLYEPLKSNFYEEKQYLKGKLNFLERKFERVRFTNTGSIL